MTLPFMNRQESTKTVIVKILSKEHPLRASAIRQLSAERGHLVSKSTIHQSLKELQESQIVNHGSEGYRLAPNWVKKVKDFSEILDTHYLVGSNQLGNIMQFSSLKEMDEFYYKFKKDFIFNAQEGDNITWAAPHVRGNFLSLGKNIELMELVKEKKIAYSVFIRGTTKLDEKCLNFFKNFNAKARLGINWPFSQVIGIFNDEALLMSQYHPEIVSSIEEMYRDCTQFEEFGNTRFATLYAKKLPQFLFIITDKNYINFYKKYLKKGLKVAE